MCDEGFTSTAATGDDDDDHHGGVVYCQPGEPGAPTVGSWSGQLPNCTGEDFLLMMLGPLFVPGATVGGVL